MGEALMIKSGGSVHTSVNDPFDLSLEASNGEEQNNKGDVIDNLIITARPLSLIAP